MTTLYNQPFAHRFGVELQDLIENGGWTSLDAAVAWVRRSGTRHLLQSLKVFLRSGASTRFVIGVDIENTSKEGLQDLLTLEAEGLSATFIHHNEAAVTFHPKLYLLSTEERARLIVGSNNLTEAGLYANTEAGLQIDARINDPIIQDAKDAIALWCDPDTGIAKRLDTTLLNDLVTEGYVLTEERLNERRAKDRKLAEARTKGQRRQLFDSKPVRVPRIQTSAASFVARMTGRVLLMRVRRASETERRTQIQIPIRVVNTHFFDNMPELRSSHDNRVHRLRPARARGGLNTIKVDLPEINPLDDPVVRLERTDTDIFYETYDAESIRGRPIMDALRRGTTMNPPVTFLSVGNPARATWWRFV